MIPTTEGKIMIAVEVTRQQQIEIEDICLSHGLTISKYFANLHAANLKQTEDEVCCEEQEKEICSDLEGECTEIKQKSKKLKKTR